MRRTEHREGIAACVQSKRFAIYRKQKWLLSRLIAFKVDIEDKFQMSIAALQASCSRSSKGRP